MEKYFLAVDIGASSGRLILGCVKNGKIKLEERGKGDPAYALVSFADYWNCTATCLIVSILLSYFD